MDHADLLALFDREQRFDVTYNDSTREALPHVVRHLPRFEGGGFIVYSKLTAENADAVIAQQIDFFDSHGWDFEWKAYGHDAPADLGTRLEAQGFILEDREAVMVLDLDGEVGVQETPTTTQEIRRITVPDEIVDVVAVEEVVWQEDYRTLGDRLRRDLVETPDEISIYVAYHGGTPVSTAWIYYHLGTHFASLWGGSTLARFRGQGYYGALLSARAAEARTRGVRFLTVDAGDMSRPILQRRGFAHLSDAFAYKWRRTLLSTETQ